jgi:hypothetical protein
MLSLGMEVVEKSFNLGNLGEAGTLFVLL